MGLLTLSLINSIEPADDAVHEPIARVRAGHALGEMLIELRLKRLATPSAVEQVRLERAFAHLLEHLPEKRLRHPNPGGVLHAVVL
jgi:hypothetical protein